MIPFASLYILWIDLALDMIKRPQADILFFYPAHKETVKKRAGKMRGA